MTKKKLPKFTLSDLKKLPSDARITVTQLHQLGVMPIGLSTIREKCAKGIIPSKKIGIKHMISVSFVRTFLQNK